MSRFAPLSVRACLDAALETSIEGAERAAASSSAAGLHVDAAAREQLAAYTAAVLEIGRHVNLSAAKTPERAVEVLVVPSLGVQAAWPLGVPPRLAVDIGSGNGFPGVAVAALWPAAHVLLVERRAKKARAIQQALVEAGMENAEALACDVREIKNERPEILQAADLVMLRAVGSLGDTVGLAAPLLAPCGRIVNWKRRGLSAEERRDGEDAAQALGLDVLPDVDQPRGPDLLVVYARGGGGA